MSYESAKARCEAVRQPKKEGQSIEMWSVEINEAMDVLEGNALVDLEAALEVIEAARLFYDEDGAHVEKRQTGTCSAGCAVWPCRHQRLAQALDAFEALP